MSVPHVHDILRIHALQIRELRWSIISNVALVLLSGGGIYLFSAFSAELAQQLKLSNTQLNSIGSSLNWGGWVGIVGGVVCDRKGPIFAGYWSSGLAAAGMLLSALIVGAFGGSSSTNSTTPTVLLCISMFLFSQGQCWSYLGSMKVLMQSINGQDRGIVVGLLAAYFGLSAGVLSTFYKVFFVQAAGMGLVGSFIGFIVLTAGVQFVCFHRMAATNHSLSALVDEASTLSKTVRLQANLMRLSTKELRLIQHLQKHAAVLAILLLVTNVYHALYHDAAAFFGCALVMVAMVGLLGILPVVVVRGGLVHGGEDDMDYIDAEHKSAVGLAAAQEATVSVSEDVAVKAPDPEQPADLKAFLLAVWADIVLVLSKPSFWLLAGTIGLALGLPVTLLHNLATVVYSLVPQSDLLARLSATPTPHDSVARFDSSSQVADITVTVATLLALFSVASTLGRLLGSALMGVHNEDEPAAASGAEGRAGAWGTVAQSYARLHAQAVHLIRRFAPLRWSFIFCAIGFALASNAICVVYGLHQASSGDFSPSYLYVAVPLAGAGLGMIFAVGPVAAADLFGPQNFGRVWGLVTMMPCVTTEVLSTMIAGAIADSVMDGGTSPNEDASAPPGASYTHPFYYVGGRKFCFGPDCYNSSFIISIGTGLLALLTARLLARRIVARPDELGRI